MMKHTISIHTGKHDKAHKSHKTTLRFQASMKFRYYPLEVGWLRPVLENSNRVLEDLNIIGYPQSVITPASQSFLAARTIARV